MQFHVAELRLERDVLQSFDRDAVAVYVAAVQVLRMIRQQRRRQDNHALDSLLARVRGDLHNARIAEIQSFSKFQNHFSLSALS